MEKKLAVYQQTKQALKAPQTVERFAELLGEAGAKSFLNGVAIAVASNEQLQQCEPMSIIQAALQSATLRLSVDPSLGQAYIVPFGNKATFVCGYRGYEQLALRTGKYRYINVANIYEGQKVEEDQLRGVHSIEGTRKPSKAAIIGYLLYFELRDGYSKTFYMTESEIVEHAKRYSKSYGYKTSAWTTNFHEMARKTVLRLGLATWGYFNPQDAAIVQAVDDMGGDENIIDAEWMTQQEEQPPMTEDEALDALGFGKATGKNAGDPA